MCTGPCVAVIDSQFSRHELVKKRAVAQMSTVAGVGVTAKPRPAIGGPAVKWATQSIPSTRCVFEVPARQPASSGEASGPNHGGTTCVG